MHGHERMKVKLQRLVGRRSSTSVILFLALYLALMFLASCRSNAPSDVETKLAAEAKKMKIGDKDWKNPTADSLSVVQTGMEHFQHHCQVCHGLEGHGTGVPFAVKMSPRVLDLGDKDVQQYTDGQLKWIIENGIRFGSMPGGKGNSRMRRCGASCASFGILLRKAARAFPPSIRKAKNNTTR
jgi:mono/diheme cytochrome c family protein